MARLVLRVVRGSRFSGSPSGSGFYLTKPLWLNRLGRSAEIGRKAARELSHAMQPARQPALIDYQRGVECYWQMTFAQFEAQPAELVLRVCVFPQLAPYYTARRPPHFTKQDLATIINWAYTDHRWRGTALGGLNSVSDAAIQTATAQVANLENPAAATDHLLGLVRGVGIFGVSAILAAALPQRFPVVSPPALLAVRHYYSPDWIEEIPRDQEGRFQPTQASYVRYTDFCRQTAASLSQQGVVTQLGSVPWYPRHVDMALWGMGRQLEG
jgi:hypothetical protein